MSYVNRPLAAGLDGGGHGDGSIQSSPARQDWSSWDFFTDANYTKAGGGQAPIRDLWGQRLDRGEEGAIFQVTFAALVIAVVLLALTCLGAFKKMKRDSSRQSLVDDLRDIERRKAQGKIESEKQYEAEKARALAAFRENKDKPLGAPPPPAPIAQPPQLYTAAEREDTAPLMSDEYPHLPTRRQRPLWRRTLDRLDRDLNDPAVKGAIALIIAVLGLVAAAALAPSTLLKAIAVGVSGVATACLLMYFSSVTESDRAKTGTATTLTLGHNASSVEGKYVGWRVAIVKGAGEGQTRTVTEYDADTKVLTVDPQWYCDPDATSSYVLCAPYGQWGRLSNDETYAKEAWRQQERRKGDGEQMIGQYVEAVEGQKFYGALSREERGSDGNDGEPSRRGTCASALRNLGATMVGLASVTGWYCILATTAPPDTSSGWGGGGGVGGSGGGSAPGLFYLWVASIVFVCCLSFLLACGRYFTPELRVALGLALLAVGLGCKPVLDHKLPVEDAWIVGLVCIAVVSLGGGLCEASLPFALQATGGGGEGFATCGGHLGGLAVVGLWYASKTAHDAVGWHEAGRVFPVFFVGAFLLLFGVIGALIVIGSASRAESILPPPISGVRENYVVSLLLAFMASQALTYVATFASLPMLIKWAVDSRQSLIAAFVVSEAAGLIMSQMWFRSRPCAGATLLSTGVSSLFLSVARAGGVACIILTAGAGGVDAAIAWAAAIGFTQGCLAEVCTNVAPALLLKVRGGSEAGECGAGEVLHGGLVMRAVRGGGICVGLSVAYVLHRIVADAPS